MRRYRLVQLLLVLGVIVGFGAGIASVVHHRGHCRHHRPPAAASAPASTPAR